MKRVLTFIFLGIFMHASFGQVNRRFEEGAGKKENPTETTTSEGESDNKDSDQEETNFWDKVVYGGSLGLGFGNVQDFVTTTPQVGYWVAENFMVGGGYILNYIRVKQGLDLNTGLYEPLDDPAVYWTNGPSAFSNFYVMEQFMIGAQFEYLSHDYITIDVYGTIYEDRRKTPVLFLQGGLSQPIGTKGRAQFGIRYDIIQDPYSPYSSGIIPFMNFLF